jgi:molybdopterin-guanine dinucleotide biosynthesis protein A
LSVESEAFELGSAAFVPVSAPFMPDGPLSRCIAPPDEAPPRSEGALCCAVEPADPAPAPCAFAKPVPAIRAAAATEIKKRLVIRMSPHVFLYCPIDNERNCAMFRNIGGSADFVL